MFKHSTWLVCISFVFGSIGCFPGSCPDGYLRDNNGNCVEVGDDDDVFGDDDDDVFGDDDDDVFGDDDDDTGSGGGDDREDLAVSFSCYDCLGSFEGGEEMDWSIRLENKGDVGINNAVFMIWLVADEYYDEVCSDGNLSNAAGYNVHESSLAGTECDPIAAGSACNCTRSLTMPDAQSGSYFWMAIAAHDGGDDDPWNNIHCSPVEVTH
jgi:hypothetical protein